MPMPRLLDDFSRPADARAAGWTAFSDQVMGGLSQGRAAVESVLGRPALRLQGTVSLQNNGGFLQIARPLADLGSATLDARAYEGLAFTVCAGPGSYFVHLRTADTQAPWQYYGAELHAQSQWTEVVLRWADFTPQRLGASLDVGRLVRVGVVAAKAAFEADIALAQLALVP